MNQRGQEFSGFRLLIDAILVLMILVIIMGILGWVNSLQFQISEKRLFEGFSKAVNSPNGKTIVERDITLAKESSYGARGFASPGVPEDCILFEALGIAGLELSRGDMRIDVKENLQLDIFYQCIKATDPSAECSEETCDICCKISFGKEFSGQDD